MKDIRTCVAVVNGTFCDCGGVMEADEGMVLLTEPPRRRMHCPFCGNSEVILNSESDTHIQFKELDQ